MDYKITGLIWWDGNYGRFEIQFILKGILDFKKYAHRAQNVVRNVEYYMSVDKRTKMLMNYNLNDISGENKYLSN